MIICVITTTRETWRGPVKHYLAGYSKMYGARVNWLQNYNDAVWFAPESVLDQLLKRLNMISGLDVQIEQIEIIP